MSFLLAGVLGGGTGVAEAQSEEVEVTYRALITSGMTIDEAREQAVQGALAEAVRQGIGTEIQSEQAGVTIEKGDELVERFSEVIRTSTAGEWTDYEVLDEEIEEMGRERYYRVHVEAEVQATEGRPDPGFELDLNLNDKLYFDRGSAGDSDEIVLTVESTRDAYLMIFNVTPDTVSVLLPNSLVTDNGIEAGEPFQFPSRSMRRAGLRLRAEVPDGRSDVTERMFVVATKEKITFRDIPEYQVRDGALTTVQASQRAINRWLVNIPRDQRAVATVTYDVVRKN